jgi:hypothetical protein
MKTYLKLLFSVVSIAAVIAGVAKAQNTAPAPVPAPAAMPSPAPSAAAAPATTAAPTAPVAAAPAATTSPPVASAPAATPPAAAAPSATAPVGPSGTASAASAIPMAPASALAPAHPYYNYAHDESEYSVMLPEAPESRTIFRESPETTQFLESPPTDSASIGEIATFKRVDIDTEELFNVKITFLKARKNFLQELTEEKIKNMLAKQFRDKPLTNPQFSYSAGSNTLKWASLSGFTLDDHHRPAFNAIHYLTGLQSIVVVQVQYSIENKTFQEYYNTLVNGISYCAL